MLRTRLPVRSALFKQHTGGLVVRWVTTGESPLLNVFLPFDGCCLIKRAFSFCNHTGMIASIRAERLEIVAEIVAP
jgi:hypothetical protein